jgi:hypothetical protein
MLLGIDEMLVVKAVLELEGARLVADGALSLPVGLSVQHWQDLFRLEDVVGLTNFTGSLNCLQVLTFILELVFIDLRHKVKLSASLVLLDVEMVPWSLYLLERKDRPCC